MKEYYIHNGYKLDGPYTFEEVQQLPLTAYHSIWHVSPIGLTTVDDLVELRTLKNTPITLLGKYKEILPISGMNLSQAWGNKVITAFKKMYAAFFY